jgi:hypothetical protein
VTVLVIVGVMFLMCASAVGFLVYRAYRGAQEAVRHAQSDLMVPPPPAEVPGTPTVPGMPEAAPMPPVPEPGVPSTPAPQPFDGTLSDASVCPHCNGAGYTDCPMCEGGEMQCPMCQGTGKGFDGRTCSMCNGTGHQVCPLCQGEGRMMCPMCSGTGKSPFAAPNMLGPEGLPGMGVPSPGGPPADQPSPPT